MIKKNIKVFSFLRVENYSLIYNELMKTLESLYINDDTFDVDLDFLRELVLFYDKTFTVGSANLFELLEEIESELLENGK